MKRVEAKVLIVDDDRENLDIASILLSELPCAIETAMSGEEALEKMGQTTPDIILLDIVMPKIDGYELCKIIKANPKYCEIPIIFLTSKDEMDDVIKGFELGAVDYIKKPFFTYELLSRVQAHMNNYLTIKEREEQERKAFENYRRESIYDLSTNIAHHWRQPLTIMNLAAFNAKSVVEEKCGIDDELAHYFTTIEENCANLSRVITIFTEKLTSDDDKRAPLSKILRDTIFLMEGEIGMMVVTNNIPEELFMEFPQKQFLELFGIFLRNTAEVAAEKGIERPEIEFRFVMEELDSWSIEIEDNLGGTDFDPIDQIFDPYATSAFPTSHKGLGLYVARKIVEENLNLKIVAQNSAKGLLIKIYRD